MYHLSPSSQSRLRRLMVVVLAGLSPVVMPVGVAPAEAASYPLYSSSPLAGHSGHAADGQEGSRPSAPAAVLHVALHRQERQLRRRRACPRPARRPPLPRRRLRRPRRRGAQARHAEDSFPGRARRLQREARLRPDLRPQRRPQRHRRGDRRGTRAQPRLRRGPVQPHRRRIGQPGRRPRPAHRDAGSDVQGAGARCRRAHHRPERRPPLHRRRVPPGRIDQVPQHRGPQRRQRKPHPRLEAPDELRRLLHREGRHRDGEPPGCRRHDRRRRRGPDAPRRWDVRALRLDPRGRTRRPNGTAVSSPSTPPTAASPPGIPGTTGRCSAFPCRPTGRRPTSPRAAAAAGSGPSSPAAARVRSGSGGSTATSSPSPPPTSGSTSAATSTPRCPTTTTLASRRSPPTA